MTREDRYMTKVAKVICSRGARVEQVAEKKKGEAAGFRCFTFARSTSYVLLIASPIHDTFS